MRSWERWTIPQYGLNMTPLLAAESGEPEAVVSSKRPDDFRWDHLLVNVGQWDFKDDGLALVKRVGDESSQTTLAQGPAPSPAGLVPAVLAAGEYRSGPRTDAWVRFQERDLPSA